MAKEGWGGKFYEKAAAAIFVSLRKLRNLISVNAQNALYSC